MINNILNANDFFSQNNINVFYDSNTKVIKLLNTSEGVHIEIYSVLGQKVISTDIVGEKYFPNLSSGVYIYKLSKGQSIKTGKILIN